MMLDRYTAKSGKRNVQLDLMKLLSCIAVVGLHSLRNDNHLVSTVIYQLCAFAVPCFFASSGAVLLNKKNVTITYSIRKIFGVVRVVVIWHILLYGGMLLWDLCSNGLDTIQWSAYGVNCAKNIIRCLLQLGPFWQFWYLGAMCLLYLLLPLLSRIFQSPNGGRYAVVLWGVLAAVSVGIQLMTLLTGRSFQGDVTQSFRLWTWLQYFVLGGLLPRITEWMKARFALCKHVLLAVFVTAIAVALRIVTDRTLLHVSKVEYFYDDPMTIVWVIILASLMMRLELSSGSQKIVNWFAPLIMGVYIVHVQVRDMLWPLFPKNSSLDMVLFACIVGFVSFLIAYILKKLPFGRYLTEL